MQHIEELVKRGLTEDEANKIEIILGNDFYDKNGDSQILIASKIADKYK